MVGAVELAGDDRDLVFVTSDAQLLRFPASAVRPQGRSAGGMAGIRLAPGQQAVSFGAVDPARDNVVVTVSGSSAALPGTEPGSVKVTPYDEYPPKGRGTGGVRCHRFLRGEDTLILAWAGAGAALGPRQRPASRSTCRRPPAGATGRAPRPASRSRRSPVPRPNDRTVTLACRPSASGPLQLELDLLGVLAALVLDGELTPSRDADPLTGDLDPERLVGLQRVRQAAQLGRCLGGGVDAFDVSWLLGHQVGPFRSSESAAPANPTVAKPSDR